MIENKECPYCDGGTIYWYDMDGNCYCGDCEECNGSGEVEGDEE